MRKVLPVIFVLAIMLMMTVPVMADEAETYPVWIGGTQVTSENAADIFNDGKLLYDAASGTLTAKAADCISGDGLEEKFNSIIYSEDPLTIEAPEGLILNNENATNAIYGKEDITVKGDLNVQCSPHAIFSSRGDILLEGNVKPIPDSEDFEKAGNTGDIVASEGNVTLKGNVKINSTGDSINCGKELQVTGGLEARGRVLVSKGPAVIEGNVSVIEERSQNAIRVEGSSGDGQQGCLYINGNVTASSPTEGGWNSGIYAASLIHLNGDVTVEGFGGLLSNGDIEILGGTCQITGGSDVGIDAAGAIRLVSGDFTVTGSSKTGSSSAGSYSAIYTHSGSLEIGRGVTGLTATGGTSSPALRAGKDDGLLIHRFLKISEPENGTNTGRYVVDSNNEEVNKVVLARKPEPEVLQTPVPSQGLIENGKAQPLLKEGGSGNGGVMEYAVGSEEPSDEDYTDVIPAAVEPGTYNVWYKVTGDDSHRDSAAACLTVTVKSLYQAAVEKAQAAKTRISKAGSQKKGTALVKWKKTAGVSGYQITYSTSKAFRKAKSKKVSSSRTKVTLKKLKKGKTYYIKARPYTKVTDKATGKSRIVYGKYSGVKKVKIRKR